MCAIVDANIASEVFGPRPQPTGAKFFEWLEEGTGRLVAGGQLLEELENGSPGFRKWASVAVGAGKLRIVNKEEVDTRTCHIQSQGACKSDDPHVIALAQVSGARLLYSNDTNLQGDFTDKQLIDNPRGKVYSTLKHKSFHRSHQQLLRSNLCGTSNP